MKYLLISAILGFGFLLLYSRLRPYIQFAQRIVKLVNNPQGEQTSQTTKSAARQVEKKLIQCAACHTFIPADRAVGGRAGLSSYCSTECLEKAAVSKKQKLAG